LEAESFNSSVLSAAGLISINGGKLGEASLSKDDRKELAAPVRVTKAGYSEQ